MIKKVANNESNQEEEPNLEPIEKIVEKLNYYRSLFPKLSLLNGEEIFDLQKDIATFFNLKPVRFNSKPPRHMQLSAFWHLRTNTFGRT